MLLCFVGATTRAGAVARNRILLSPRPGRMNPPRTAARQHNSVGAEDRKLTASTRSQLEQDDENGDECVRIFAQVSVSPENAELTEEAFSLGETDCRTVPGEGRLFASFRPS